MRWASQGVEKTVVLTFMGKYKDGGCTPSNTEISPTHQRRAWNKARMGRYNIRSRKRAAWICVLGCLCRSASI